MGVGQQGPQPRCGCTTVYMLAQSRDHVPPRSVSISRNVLFLFVRVFGRAAGRERLMFRWMSCSSSGFDVQILAQHSALAQV